MPALRRYFYGSSFYAAFNFQNPGSFNFYYRSDGNSLCRNPYFNDSSFAAVLCICRNSRMCNAGAGIFSFAVFINFDWNLLCPHFLDMRCFSSHKHVSRAFSNSFRLVVYYDCSNVDQLGICKKAGESLSFFWSAIYILVPSSALH